MKKINWFSLLLIAVFILGALFRIYQALNLPLLCDEKEFIQLAKNVSLGSARPLAWLAKDSILGEHNMLSIYAIKLGMFIFGDNIFGFRFFSGLIFGILSLVLIYRYVADSLGRGAAFFALCLISFEQYHLFHSAISTPHALRQLIILLTLVLFHRIQQEPQKFKNFILFGILSGLGYYTQPTFLLFIIILLLYLVLTKGFAGVFKNKRIYISILFMLITILPDLFWNRLSGAWHFFFDRQSYANLRLSWGGLNFFAIEIINFFKGVDWRLLISWEHPIIRWYFGLIVFAGAIYSFKYVKNKFIALQLFIFFAVILVFSFFPRGEFWWANLAFIPGIILGAFMLSNLFWQKKTIWKPPVLFIMLFLVFSPTIMKANVLAPPLKDATFADYDLDLTRWYIQHDRLDEAINEVEAALAVCPNLVRGYDLLGECFFRKGDPDKAYGYWMKVLELEPYSSPTVDKLSRLRYLKPHISFLVEGYENIIGKDFEKAAAQFNQFLSFEKDCAVANFYLGIALSNLASGEEPMYYFERTISIKPDFVIAKLAIGQLLLKKERYQEALVNFNQAIMLNPDFSESYYWAAFTYQSKGDHDNAEKLYRRLLRLSPVYIKAYLRLKEIYLNKAAPGRFRKAENMEKAAESINPKRKTSFFYEFTGCPDYYRYLHLPGEIARQLYLGD